MADFTAGLLAAIAALAGLVARGHERAPGLEVSLLGAALAVQAQRFVSVETLDRERRAHLTADQMRRRGEARAAQDELEPYYRAYAAADGFLVLACLNERQRVAAGSLLGLEDPWAANPQAPPADSLERARRHQLVAEFERRIAAEPVEHWVHSLRATGVPAAEVRSLEQLFEHEQIEANGLVQTLEHDRVGPVKLLGSVFKVDGLTGHPGRSVPALGEHTKEVLTECRQA
jgi:crotonobetainyl-CoA:carnitine CoA-transferase CaiB-like acyl-CoA transferase